MLLGNGQRWEWSQRRRRKLLEIMDTCTILFVVVVLWDIHISKLIKLYTLNIYYVSLYLHKVVLQSRGEWRWASVKLVTVIRNPISFSFSTVPPGRQRASPDWQGISKQEPQTWNSTQLVRYAQVTWLLSKQSLCPETPHRRWGL